MRIDNVARNSVVENRNGDLGKCRIPSGVTREIEQFTLMKKKVNESLCGKIDLGYTIIHTVP